MVVIAVAAGSRAATPFPRRRRETVGARLHPSGLGRCGFGRLVAPLRASGTRARVRLAAKAADGTGDANDDTEPKLESATESSSTRWTNSTENLLAQLGESADSKKKKKKKNKEGDKKKNAAETKAAPRDANANANEAEAEVRIGPFPNPNTVCPYTTDTFFHLSQTGSASMRNQFSRNALPMPTAARNADAVSETRIQKNPYQGRVPWTQYPLNAPGVAGGPAKAISDLRWSPNGNALLQVDRQTIPYNQVRVVLGFSQILTHCLMLCMECSYASLTTIICAPESADCLFTVHKSPNTRLATDPFSFPPPVL